MKLDRRLTCSVTTDPDKTKIKHYPTHVPIHYSICLSNNVPMFCILTSTLHCSASHAATKPTKKKKEKKKKEKRRWEESGKGWLGEKEEKKREELQIF